jgi:hypothetical protein
MTSEDKEMLEEIEQKLLTNLEEDDLTGEMILEEYAMIYAANHIIKLKMDLNINILSSLNLIYNFHQIIGSGEQLEIEVFWSDFHGHFIF